MKKCHNDTHKKTKEIPLITGVFVCQKLNITLKTEFGFSRSNKETYGVKKAHSALGSEHQTPLKVSLVYTSNP